MIFQATSFEMITVDVFGAGQIAPHRLGQSGGPADTSTAPLRVQGPTRFHWYEHASHLLRQIF